MKIKVLHVNDIEPKKHLTGGTVSLKVEFDLGDNVEIENRGSKSSSSIATVNIDNKIIIEDVTELSTHNSKLSFAKNVPLKDLDKLVELLNNLK